MLPAKGLYFEILILWSLTQSIIRPEFWIKPESSKWLSLTIASAFQFEQKVLYSVSSSLWFFFNSKTNFAKSLRLV